MTYIDGTETADVAAARFKAFLRYAEEWGRDCDRMHPVFADKDFAETARRACGMTSYERTELHGRGMAARTAGTFTEADLTTWQDWVNTWDIAEEQRARFTWLDEAKTVAERPRHPFDELDYDFSPVFKDRKGETSEARQTRLAAATYYEYARESSRFRYMMALESTKQTLRGTSRELLMDSACACEAEDEIKEIERRIGGWICFLVALAPELASDMPFRTLDESRIQHAIKQVGTFFHFLRNEPVELAYKGQIARRVTKHILLSKTQPPVREVIPYDSAEVFVTTKDALHSDKHERAIENGSEFVAVRLAWGYASESDMVKSFAALLKRLKRPKNIPRPKTPRGSSVLDFFDSKLRQLAVMRLCFHRPPEDALSESGRLNLRHGESSDVRKMARRANEWFQEYFALGEPAQWFSGGEGRGRPKKRAC